MDVWQRVKQILLQPRQEWPIIAAESTTIAELYTGYIVPLAGIGPLASIIGLSVIGMSVPFVGTYRVPIISSVSHAAVSYVLTLVGVYILALIIDALAPTFLGEKNQIQALKVSVYASTAAWVAGILSLLPMLSVLQVLMALYSLYLLYLGLPVVMKVPQAKAVGYTAAVVVAAIVIFAVIGVVSGALIASPILPVPGRR